MRGGVPLFRAKAAFARNSCEVLPFGQEFREMCALSASSGGGSPRRLWSVRPPTLRHGGEF